MKKIFATLAILSLLAIPCVSMATSMSDAELAGITGQSGVTIDISAMNISLGLGTLTYGDLDGFTTVGSFTEGDFTLAGYVNVAFFPVPMHIGLDDLQLIIDIGESSTTGRTAVNIAGTLGGNGLTIDAIVADIYLDSTNGAAYDYVANSNNPFPGAFGFVSAYYTANLSNLSNNIGVVGISNISVVVPTFNIQISAH